MANVNDPNLGLSYGWNFGEEPWNEEMDKNLVILGGMACLSVLSATSTAPLTTVDGATYFVPSGATGVWAGKDNNIAIYEGQRYNEWLFIPAQSGWIFTVADSSNPNIPYTFDGSNLVESLDLSEYLTTSSSYTATGVVDFASKVTFSGTHTADTTELATMGDISSAISSQDFSGYVDTSTDQSVSGIKTFTTSPVIPDALNSNEPVSLGQLNASGGGGGFDPSSNQNISGDWTFETPLSVDTTGSNVQLGGTNTIAGLTLETLCSSDATYGKVGSILDTTGNFSDPDFFLVGYVLDSASIANDDAVTQYTGVADFSTGVVGVLGTNVGKNSSGDIEVSSVIQSSNGTFGASLEVAADASSGYVEVGADYFKLNNGTMLELGRFSAEPTGLDSNIYYNTALNKFRAYENGAWTDLIGSGGGFDPTTSEDISGNWTFETPVSIDTTGADVKIGGTETFAGASIPSVYSIDATRGKVATILDTGTFGIPDYLIQGYLLDSASMLEGEAIQRVSGISEPTTNIFSSTQSYINKSALGFDVSTTLRASNGVSEANIASTAYDDGTSEVTLAADSIKLEGFVNASETLAIRPPVYADVSAILSAYVAGSQTQTIGDTVYCSSFTSDLIGGRKGLLTYDGTNWTDQLGGVAT